MKILVLGGGQVGASIAENLVKDGNDVTVVDIDHNRLKILQDRLDIQTIVGNASHPSVLESAGAADCEMLLALTRNDETNLTACQLGKVLFNIYHRVARIRASDYVEHNAIDLDQVFGVKHVICPEQIVTNNLYELIEFPGVLQVLGFADDKIQLVNVRANQGGRLIGRELKNIVEDLPNIDCRICAIYRQGQLLIPDGDTVIQEQDEIFFVARREDMLQILNELRPCVKHIRRIMIAGGGNIGYRLAKKLEHHYEVKIIEIQQARAEWLANHLDKTMVLHGEATDEVLLKEENIDEMDVFCALTNDDEDNVMSTLLAKRQGAKRVISLVNRTSYVDLLEGNRIDSVISPHLATIGSILAHLRRGEVKAVHPLRGGQAEAIEVVIHKENDSPELGRFVGRSVMEVDMPEGCFISAIVRGETILMAHHDVVLQAEDRLIIFVANKNQFALKQIENMISVDIGYF